MKITGDWLSAAETQAVLALLTKAGHQAFCVGGCVRNDLLGVAVADVDICTDAVPDAVVALARDAGLQVIPTGIDHGTVTVLSGGVPFEVTTFRRDVATDGRHAEVAFSGDMAEDAARRDFTMNALYADASGAVFDPLGGLPDVKAGRVRFIGAAEDRIAEDYLRILRFFRFSAWYGDPAQGIDAEGLAACAAGAEGLDRISGERIGQEMRKLLSAPDPAMAVASMAQAGVLARILPGADVAALPLLLAQGRPTGWVARLAALGGDASGWRLSKAEARAVSEVSVAARDGTAPFALGDMLGDRGADALAVRCALMEQPLDAAALVLVANGQAATFPLLARDLMPELSGPALGHALARARTAWREAEGQMSRDALIALVRPPA